jgi:hypothetical protein
LQDGRSVTDLLTVTLFFIPRGRSWQP